MPTNFLTLPGELRNKIYSYCLVRGETITPWHVYHDLTPGLLCVNKMIHHEARSILYGCNRFDLIAPTSGAITQFLDKIGLTNANHLECIRIEFPLLLYLYFYIHLNVDSLRILTKIQDHCTNLKTLIMSPDSTDVMESRLQVVNKAKIVPEAIALVDVQLRKIPSLQEIIVEYHPDGPSTLIGREMRNYGWVIKVAERMGDKEDEEDEEGWGYGSELSSSDDDYYHLPNDEADDGDDYEI